MRFFPLVYILFINLSTVKNKKKVKRKTKKENE